MPDNNEQGFNIDIQAELKTLGNILEDAYKLTQNVSNTNDKTNMGGAAASTETVKENNVSPILMDVPISKVDIISANSPVLPDTEKTKINPTKSDNDMLSLKIKTLEKNLNSVSTDLVNAYKKINEAFAKPEPQDMFEERPTVLPTNLIFDDRVNKTMEAPLWR